LSDGLLAARDANGRALRDEHLFLSELTRKAVASLMAGSITTMHEGPWASAGKGSSSDAIAAEVRAGATERRPGWLAILRSTADWMVRVTTHLEAV
jgi:hypothetical protein